MFPNDVKLVGYKHLVVYLRQRHFLRLSVLYVTACKKRINCYLERLVQHLRNQSLQKRAGRGVQTRIGIDLNQVDVHVIVYHEVVAEELELIFDGIFLYLGKVEVLQVL